MVAHDSVITTRADCGPLVSLMLDRRVPMMRADEMLLISVFRLNSPAPDTQAAQLDDARAIMFDAALPSRRRE